MIISDVVDSTLAITYLIHGGRQTMQPAIYLINILLVKNTAFKIILVTDMLDLCNN
jgi:hypothetical protein